MSTSRDRPGQTRRAVLARALACRRCGYDLRGLALDGRCPECGLELVESVRAAVDPDAMRLPAIRNPKRVGDALSLLVGCVFLATVLIVARSIGLHFAALGSVNAWLIRLSPAWFPLAAAGALGVGVAATWMLAPPRGAEQRSAVRHDLRVLTGGLVGWTVLALVAFASGPFVSLELAGATLQFVLSVGIAVTMMALGGILEVVGERSRQFRTARGGRQRTREMVVAASGIGVGAVAVVLADATQIHALRILGTVVAWICTLMVMIGFVYLCVNAAWIRHALRRPPLTVEELFTPEPEPEEEDDEDEDEETATGGA